MKRLIKGAPFAISVLIGTQGTPAFYIDIYISMKIPFKFIENFAEGGWPRSLRAHPLNPPMAVFRKSDEMVPIVPKPKLSYGGTSVACARLSDSIVGTY